MSTLNESELYEEVGRQLSRDGSVTLQGIVSATGISIGSLYHRYGSREGLLASTWIDAVKVFQTRFMSELGSEGKRAGEMAALATPRFCREEPGRAAVLVCCRKSEFLGKETPEKLRQEISELNSAAANAVKIFAIKHDLSLEACQLGLVAFPLGAVKMFLPERPVPDYIDQYVVEAFRSAIRIDKKQARNS